MSTNTLDTRTTDDRIDSTTSTADTATDSTTSTADTATNTTSAAGADWVARCQRQFDPRRTGRLHNLVDKENHAMFAARYRVD